MPSPHIEVVMEEVRASGCDATHPSIYLSSHGTYVCRCLICQRCGHHTGNNNQGHYWKACKVQMNNHDKHKVDSFLNCKECMPEFHFCCPGNCELFNEDGIEK